MMAESTRMLVYQGYLRKSPPEKRIQSDKWHTRYFRLWDDKTIEYFKHEKDRKPWKQPINLSNCLEVSDSKLDVSKYYKNDYKWPFTVRLPGRLFYFIARSEEDRSVWKERICEQCSWNSGLEIRNPEYTISMLVNNGQNSPHSGSNSSHRSGSDSSGSRLPVPSTSLSQRSSTISDTPSTEYDHSYDIVPPPRSAAVNPPRSATVNINISQSFSGSDSNYVYKIPSGQPVGSLDSNYTYNIPSSQPVGGGGYHHGSYNNSDHGNYTYNVPSSQPVAGLHPSYTNNSISSHSFGDSSFNMSNDSLSTTTSRSTASDVWSNRSTASDAWNPNRSTILSGETDFSGSVYDVPPPTKNSRLKQLSTKSMNINPSDIGYVKMDPCSPTEPPDGREDYIEMQGGGETPDTPNEEYIQMGEEYIRMSGTSPPNDSPARGSVKEFKPIGSTLNRVPTTTTSHTRSTNLSLSALKYPVPSRLATSFEDDGVFDEIPDMGVDKRSFDAVSLEPPVINRGAKPCPTIDRSTKPKPPPSLSSTTEGPHLDSSGYLYFTSRRDTDDYQNSPPNTCPLTANTTTTTNNPYVNDKMIYDINNNNHHSNDNNRTPSSPRGVWCSSPISDYTNDSTLFDVDERLRRMEFTTTSTNMTASSSSLTPYSSHKSVDETVECNSIGPSGCHRDTNNNNDDGGGQDKDYYMKDLPSLPREHVGDVDGGVGDDDDSEQIENYQNFSDCTQVHGALKK